MNNLLELLFTFLALILLLFLTPAGWIGMMIFAFFDYGYEGVIKWNL